MRCIRRCVGVTLNESVSAGDLRVRIGDLVGADIRERVNTVGNSRAAVSFRRPTLLQIAIRIPVRTGDLRDPRDLTTSELRTYIARNTGVEPPASSSHFQWIHLKAIYQELEGSA